MLVHILFWEHLNVNTIVRKKNQNTNWKPDRSKEYELIAYFYSHRSFGSHNSAPQKPLGTIRSRNYGAQYTFCRRHKLPWSISQISTPHIPELKQSFILLPSNVFSHISEELEAGWELLQSFLLFCLLFFPWISFARIIYAHNLPEAIGKKWEKPDLRLPLFAAHVMKLFGQFSFQSSSNSLNGLTSHTCTRAISTEYMRRSIDAASEVIRVSSRWSIFRAIFPPEEHA